MEFSNLIYQVEDKIATVTINRPEVLNALNGETISELTTVVDQIAEDKTVNGVIITGAGDKSFVAGADIKELATKTPITGRDLSLAGQSVFRKIEKLPKPVVAAVNGFALGGGCELAMACHMRIASANARFGQPEVGLGIIPGYGGTQRLPRLVGKGIGLELLLGGGMIDAAEAYRIGLVNSVIEAFKKNEDGEFQTDAKGRKIFDREAFLADVKKFLSRILKNGPVALAYVIEAVNRGLDTDLEVGLRVEADLFGVIFSTEDVHEGLNAFLEKRGVNFTGK